MTDLAVQHARRRVCLDEVVVHPPQVVHQVGELAGLDVGVAVLDRTPGQHRRGGGHREAELHVVTGVEPPAGEVHTAGAVGHRRVAAPPDPAPGRLGPCLLCLVEPDGLLQGLAVVEHRGMRRFRAGHQHESEHETERHRDHAGDNSSAHVRFLRQTGGREIRGGARHRADGPRRTGIRGTAGRSRPGPSLCPPEPRTGGNGRTAPNHHSDSSAPVATPGRTGTRTAGR
jgi:hypothetical protein